MIEKLKNMKRLFTWRRFVVLLGVKLAFSAAGFALFLLRPMDVSPYLHTAASGELRDGADELLAPALNEAQQWCFPRELAQINRNLLLATIATEDQRFYSHPGVDPIAVARACVQNVSHLRVASGASTLSMQLVKIQDDLPRSMSGKVKQMMRAVKLENATKKDEILEAYLNRAPYGLNLIGCEAAARRYFGKPATELTLAEAALLAGLPKAPAAFEPIAHPEKALARRNHVLARMHARKYITADEYTRAVAAPLGAEWHAYPRLAPHLAAKVASRLKAGDTVRTTLDARVQEQAERLAKRYLKRFDNEINNAAIMIVDVPNAAVLARVGSADFFKSAGGQVDLCAAARSPGSALKPFTYALAMEKNLVYPSERLLDDTLDYGNYNPVNFDGGFNGLVTATEALRLSLNIPAVTVLERVGVPALYELLQRVGVRTLTKAPDFYGLGLTLGNCEVSVEDMAAAYCMLANVGEYRPLRLMREAAESAPERVLSRGTALAIYEMLEQPLPEAPSPNLVHSAGVHSRVCWKTGTSSGFHDAWAVMFNRQYLVVVWLGNADGKASRRLVGIQAALPFAAAVFQGLAPRAEALWPDSGGDLREVTVCAVSGLPASPWCAQTKTARVSRAEFINRYCDVHVRDAAEERVVERWPATAAEWNLAAIRQPIAVTTGDRIARAAGEQQRALKILTPVAHAKYVVTGEAEGDRLPLRASLNDDVALQWFLNDHYIGESRPEGPLALDIRPGNQKLICMAPNGQTDEVQFEVLEPEDMRFKASG